MLFGSESLRPATCYPQPADAKDNATDIPSTAVFSRLSFIPRVSPPASPHWPPAIEYYPPLPRTTRSPACQAHSPLRPVGWTLLLRPSHCLEFQAVEEWKILLPCTHWRPARRLRKGPASRM